jgi:hypothetical protein
MSVNWIIWQTSLQVFLRTHREPYTTVVIPCFGAEGVLVGPEFRVNRLTAFGHYDPAVHMAPNGHFVVVLRGFFQDSVNGNHILAQRCFPQGVPFGVGP